MTPRSFFARPICSRFLKGKSTAQPADLDAGLLENLPRRLARLYQVLCWSVREIISPDGNRRSFRAHAFDRQRGGITAKLKFKHFFQAQCIDSSTAGCAAGFSVDEERRYLNRAAIKQLFIEERRLVDQ